MQSNNSYQRIISTIWSCIKTVLVKTDTTHSFTHTCIHTHMRTCTHARTHTHTHKQTNAYIYENAIQRTIIRPTMISYTHTHTHTHKHTMFCPVLIKSFYIFNLLSVFDIFSERWLFWMYTIHVHYIYLLNIYSPVNHAGSSRGFSFVLITCIPVLPRGPTPVDRIGYTPHILSSK